GRGEREALAARQARVGPQMIGVDLADRPRADAFGGEERQRLQARVRVDQRLRVARQPAAERGDDSDAGDRDAVHRVSDTAPPSAPWANHGSPLSCGGAGGGIRGGGGPAGAVSSGVSGSGSGRRKPYSENATVPTPMVRPVPAIAFQMLVVSGVVKPDASS